MLSKSIIPKTKAELIRSIQQATFRSFDVLEGSAIENMVSKAVLRRAGATIVVLKP
jgi:hypothetical protein